MDSGSFRLFAGLGNPGKKYSENRHNIGFKVLDLLAKKNNLNFSEKCKLHGLLATCKINHESIYLLKPNTYMNESGISIRSTINWFNLNTDQLVVLVDDMDLPLGRLRIRSKGSSGGHNGLKSIISHLGTNDFCRIRIGIGSPSLIPEQRKAKTNSYVLGNFTVNENIILEKVLQEVEKCLNLINKDNFESVCTRINSYRYQ